MRLRTILSSSSQEVLDALEGCNIKTPEDFLFSSTPEEIYSSLPTDTPVKYADLVNARNAVLASMAAEGISADILYKQEGSKRDEHANKWKTGILELDLLLQDINYGLIELSGTRGSGKTALALHITLSCLMQNENINAHWIDTSGDFSAERISQSIAHAKYTDPPSALLDRLGVSLALDMTGVQEALDAILDSLSPTQPQTYTLRLIVLDTLTPLLSPFLSGTSAQGHATMITFMRHLQAVARSYSLLIIVTNNAVSAKPVNALSAFPRTVFKPALGPSFSFLTESTIWLSRAREVLPMSRYTQIPEDNDAIIVEIFRSRSSMSRRWWPMKVSQGMITPYNPAP